MKEFLVHINNVVSFDDRLIDSFKQLFTDTLYWNAFNQMVMRTRNYEYCLLMCDNFERFLKANRTHFTEKEFREIDQQIILLRLRCLDSTDRWHKFLEFFEETLATKDYKLTYSLDSKSERFGRFYLGSDERFHYVHFLFIGSDRFDIVQRKAKREIDGKSTNHLRHHTQSDLTDEEIEHRYKEVLKWAESVANMNNRKN